MRTSVRRYGAACGVWIGLLLATAGMSTAQDAAKHAIAFDDLIAMHRVAEAEPSPDGKWVAYIVATPDMDANRNATNLWMAPLAGGDAIQLTRTGKDSSPKWSPDGRSIAFLSARSGDSQVYLLSMDGGEAHPLTKLSTGADFVKWSPDGKTVAFTSSVYPDCKDDECNKKRNEEKEKNKVKAHVAEGLLYRHWTHWNEGPRAHLFVQAADGSVFTHLHPLGSISMAAQKRFAERAPASYLANQPLDLLCSPASTTLSFPYAFPKAGVYRVWLQIKLGGQILTTPYRITVE